jgi:hypothetical protein
MPAGEPPGAGPATGDEPPGQLAGLAGAVAARLAAAGHEAGPGDREALRRAAAGVGQVRQLLAGDG